MLFFGKKLECETCSKVEGVQSSERMAAPRPVADSKAGPTVDALTCTIQRAQRRVVVVDASSTNGLSERTISSALPGAPIDALGLIFCFPPVGFQRPNLGRELFDEEIAYREALLHCSEVAANLGSLIRPSIAEVLYPAAEAEAISRDLIQQPQYAQPCLFALQFALATLWTSKGAAPMAVLGHSVGEFVASVFAGALRMEAALALVCERGRLMAQLPRLGAMLSVRCPPAVVEKAISQANAERDAKACSAPTVTQGAQPSLGCCVAAYNGPAAVVISGDWAALSDVVQRLPKGTKTTLVSATHPDHSAHMHPLYEPLYQRAIELFDMYPPSDVQRPLFSGLTGGVMRAKKRRAAQPSSHCIDISDSPLLSPHDLDPSVSTGMGSNGKMPSLEDTDHSCAEGWAEHWAQHMIQPVRLEAAFDALFECARSYADTTRQQPKQRSWSAVCIEMGDGLLTKMLEECAAKKAAGVVTAEEATRHPKSTVRFVITLDRGEGSLTKATHPCVQQRMDGLLKEVRRERLLRFVLGMLPADETERFIV